MTSPGLPGLALPGDGTRTAAHLLGEGDHPARRAPKRLFANDHCSSLALAAGKARAAMPSSSGIKHLMEMKHGGFKSEVQRLVNELKLKACKNWPRFAIKSERKR